MVIKRNFLLIIMLAMNFVILVTPVNAQIIYVDIDKTIYYPPDKVTVNVTVINTMPFSVNWSVECGFAIKDGSYPPLLLSEPVELKSNEMKTVSFSMDVLETTLSGNYEANVKLLNDSEVLNQASKDFEIRETKKEIDAYLRSCEDASCTSSKSVFFVGEKVYIVLFSDTPDLTIIGKLKTPSRTLDLIFVDKKASATLNEIGSYEVLAELSKQDYQDKTVTLQFSVIEEEPDIREEEICIVNQICEDKENHKTCPQDCPSGSSDGYCDKLTDNKCDPDCSIEEDWDCHCGNGVCDYGENSGNCLVDCPSGLSDGYCDGMSDDICDPDCTYETDPDCIREIVCGDYVCEDNETYETCPQDCPSGSSDGYCDKLTDNKCDPDCSIEEDWDCHCGNGVCDYGENSGNCLADCLVEIDIISIIVPSVVLIVILIIILFLYKKKK